MSTDVLTATVMGSSMRVEEPKPGFTNNIYTVSLKVDMFYKGSFGRGNVIQVSYWQAATRPAGWVGHTGQYKLMPAEGAAVQVYLKKSEDASLKLLEPKGFDEL